MLKKNSLPMRFFNNIGMHKIAWSLRRLYCPVKKTDLVLEIGSGGNPYLRSNVLSDAFYEETRERHYEKIVSDRPMVISYAENLPFKDDSFDFIIASHVIEHSKKPDEFINEIQRVGKAGYIEAPDAFMERMTGYLDHRLEVSVSGGMLLVRKKEDYTEKLSNSEAIDKKARYLYQKQINENPFRLHVRYYWDKSKGIDYKVLNPDYEFDWDPPVTEKHDYVMTKSVKIKKFILKLSGKLFSQHRRNRNIYLSDFLQCPDCMAQSFSENQQSISCNNCGAVYKKHGKSIIDFNNKV